MTRTRGAGSAQEFVVAESAGAVGDDVVIRDEGGRARNVTSLRRNDALRAMGRQQNTLHEPDVKIPVGKTGFLVAAVGSEHAVRFKNPHTGKLEIQQLRVRNLAKFRGREQELEAICLSCQRVYPDMDALMEAHLPEEEMHKAGEAHVVCHWSGKEGELLPDAQEQVDRAAETLASLPKDAPEAIRKRWAVSARYVPEGLISDVLAR